MKLLINPSTAVGEVDAPISKSHLHRLLIAAAQADGETVIHGASSAIDVIATIDCLNALGVEIKRVQGGYRVSGTDMKHSAPRSALPCRESGSTLRFLIPLAALSGARVHIVGSDSLLSRPLDEYTRLFAERGLLISKSGRVLTVDGPLSAGEFTVGAQISSQFLTGLLLSLPSADGDSVIRVAPPLNSGGYIDLTLSVLESFDVFVHREDEYTFTVPGNQRFMHGEYTAEGDWSGAAYILALNYLGGKCRVRGLSNSSRQPDSAAEDIFARVAAADGKPIDLSATPDLAPIAIALAAYRGGAHFTGTGRLCHKESNRAMAMKSELARLGCDIEVGEDCITVPPSVLHAPTEPICAHNDHRIAMAMAILLTRLGGEIEGAECVKKSYPEFFRHLIALGVDIKEIG